MLPSAEFGLACDMLLPGADCMGLMARAAAATVSTMSVSLHLIIIRMRSCHGQPCERHAPGDLCNQHLMTASKTDTLFTCCHQVLIA
jgi:hypothetical protein